MRLLTALDFLSRYLLALDERILPAVRVLLHNHEVLSHAGFLPMELVLQILKNTPTSGEFLERLTLNLLKTMAGKRNLIAIPRTVIAYRALYNHLASQGLVADSDPVLQPFLETLENLDLPLQPND